MKLPRIRFDVNFLKVALGVVFSLVWGQIMYLIWPHPAYLVFVLFYLVAGSVLIKWVFFEAIDRVHLRVKLKALSRKIESSDKRVLEAVESGHLKDGLQLSGGLASAAGGPGERLRSVVQETVSLGAMAKTALEQATWSLERKDLSMATRIIEHDSEIDARRYAIESDCIDLIRAGLTDETDLRQTVAMLGIVTELERMGDYAEGIAKITLMIGPEPRLTPPAEIRQMADKAMEMLEGSLQALSANDEEKAKHVSKQDDEIDTLYSQAFRHLVMHVIANPADIAGVTWLMWAAHNLERFADRVTNICERVVFGVNGEITEVKVSKY